MSENPKLIVLFDTFTELYCIPTRPEKLSYNGAFFINDIVVDLKRNGFSSAKWFTSKRKPIAAHGINVETYRDGFVNESGETLTNEERAKFAKDLRSSYDEDDEEWGDVEQQIRWTHFEKQWKANMKSREIRIDYDVDIQLAPVSEYPEIQLVTSWDDILTAKEAMFNYFPSSVRFLENKCLEMGLIRVVDSRKNMKEFSIPNHSGIRFAQIGDVYICNDKDENFQIARGTYQYCVDKRKEHLDRISDIVTRGYNKAFPVGLNDMSSRIVLEFIDSFESKYGQIKPMSKSYNDYSVLRKWFYDFKTQFTNSIK